MLARGTFSSWEARVSRSATIVPSRSDSAITSSASAVTSVRSGARRATSAALRIDAIGLRSSCEASDTNRRRWASDASNRPSIAFIVSASSAISSRVAGTGIRSCRVPPEIVAVRSVIARTGRSAREASTHATSAVARVTSGASTQIVVRTRFTVLSIAAVDVPIT